MENKMAKLKDIRSRLQQLDPRDATFDKQFEDISKEAMNCMEGINDRQEKNWIEKGQEVIDQDSSGEPAERDRALSYLKEAVHNVILREDNYRE